MERQHRAERFDWCFFSCLTYEIIQIATGLISNSCPRIKRHFPQPFSQRLTQFVARELHESFNNFKAGVRSYSGTPFLKTVDFSKESVVSVKRKNGFTKTIPWTGNPGKIRRGAF